MTFVPPVSDWIRDNAHTGMFCSKELVTGSPGESVERASIPESDHANQIINIKLSQLVELEKSHSNCEGRLSEKENQINDLKLWKDLEGQIAVLEANKSKSETRLDGIWIKVFSHDVSGGLFKVDIFFFYNFTQEYPI